MADLIKQLLEDELSEAQWDELEAQLNATPEEADRLAAEAALQYKDRGLAEPSWPGRRSRSRRNWRWGALGLGLAVAAGWAYHRQAPSEDSAQVTQVRHEQADLTQRVLEAPAQPIAAGRAVQPAGRVLSGDSLGIHITLDAVEMVRVTIQDAQGTELRRLHNGLLKEGAWAFTWDGLTDLGRKAEPGGYVIVLQARGRTQRKEIRLR